MKSNYSYAGFIVRNWYCTFVYDMHCRHKDDNMRVKDYCFGHSESLHYMCRFRSHRHKAHLVSLLRCPSCYRIDSLQVIHVVNTWSDVHQSLPPQIFWPFSFSKTLFSDRVLCATTMGRGEGMKRILISLHDSTM